MSREQAPGVPWHDHDWVNVTAIGEDHQHLICSVRLCEAERWIAPTHSEEMIELMRYANAAAVGAALGVSRATAARWARGENVDAIAVQRVRRLFDR